jgi:glycosidase
MKRIFSIIILAIIFTSGLLGQAVTTDPAVPTMGATVKILFDSSKDNNNKGLKNFTGDLYAHIGVTLNGSRWQNVISPWAVNVPKIKFTNLGSYKYELLITPDITSYFGLLAGQKATEICLVIRNSDGTKQTDPDIFLPVFEAGLNAVITAPSKQFMVADLNSQFQILASSTNADSLSLYVNNNFITSGASANSLNYTYTASAYGGAWIKAVAWDKPKSAADSFFVYVRGTVASEALPAGLKDGINYTSPTSATLVLHAPYKQFAFALGDFTGWLLSDKGYMKRTPDGERYWVELTGLQPGREYRFQYLVDTILIAEPYADKLLDPFNDQYINSATYPDLIKYPKDTTSGIVAVLQTDQQPYQWTTTSFQLPPQKKLVIYELLVRDYVGTHSYKTIIDSLWYLKKLGINAIELMPVNEFEGNLSWGYNPSFYFAPDKYYGTKNDLKAFVDSCHSMGIAVIIDLVLNHSFGQSPFVQLYLSSYGSDQIFMKTPNPWFNASSPNPSYKWGADFNHESPHTQALVDRVTSYWLTEYKIDGFRFDFTKGFTNTPGDGWASDNARINILKRMADKIWAVKPGAYVILEHLAANSEEKVLAEYGMLLWGNMNYQYGEAAMGYPSDLSNATAKARTWNAENLVSYMESHDEQRIMYKAINFGNSGTDYNIKDTETALRRMELASVFLLTIPGPKMIWQFGELGYDISIDMNGRTGNKPVLWVYYTIIPRYRLFLINSLLNKLKTSNEVFSTSDYTYSLDGKQKQIQLNSPGMKVNILGNFDVASAQVNPAFQQTGKWYDYFEGDSVTITSTSNPITLLAGEYKIFTTKRLASPKRLLGIEDEYVPEKGSIATLYPNPSDGDIKLRFNEPLTSRCVISLTDLSGRRVYEAEAGPGTIDYSFPSGLAERKGVWLVTIKTGYKSETLKLIRR